LSNKVPAPPTTALVEVPSQAVTDTRNSDIGINYAQDISIGDISKKNPAHVVYNYEDEMR